MVRECDECLQFCCEDCDGMHECHCGEFICEDCANGDSHSACWEDPQEGVTEDVD